MNMGWLIAGAMAIAIGSAGAGYLSGRVDGRTQCNVEQLVTQTADQAAVIDKQVEVRKEEGRRNDVVETVSNQAAAAVAGAAVGVVGADNVAERLRVELDTAKRRFSSSIATCDARIAEQRQATIAQYDLLAELYRESDRAQGELAKEAERYRTPGVACEAIYDGVRNSPR